MLDKNISHKYPNNVRLSDNPIDCKDSKFIWDSKKCYNTIGANDCSNCGTDKKFNYF